MDQIRRTRLLCCTTFCMQHSTVPCSRNNEHCYGQETTYKCSSVAEMGYRLATIYMGQKRDRMLCPFRVRSWVSIQYNVAWSEVYLCTKWHLDSLSRLATIDMGRKLGGGFARCGELGPHLTQRGLGRGLPPCHVSF